MVLHVLTDDKFTEYAIKQFADCNKCSELVVLPTGNGNSYVNSDLVKRINYPSPQFLELLSNLGNYTGIVLHGIFWPFCEEIIRATPENVKIAWYFWGGELYSRPDVMYSYIAPITKFLHRLHLIKKNQKYENSFIWQLPIDLYKRIDFCLTDELEEFDFVKQYLCIDMQHAWYSYYSLEDTIGSLLDYRSTGRSIMFCNSAAIENNMFDAALRLSRPKYRKLIGDRQVIMPMGYGTPWVKNLMLKFGPKMFRNFKPVVDFIPREQYNQLMTECSTLILPYYSSAGKGNIITALWLGMRVYLSEKSIAYQHFKRIGTHVFSLESDFIKYGCDILPDDVVAQNRCALQKEYSKENVYYKASQLTKILGS